MVAPTIFPLTEPLAQPLTGPPGGWAPLVQPVTEPLGGWTPLSPPLSPVPPLALERALLSASATQDAKRRGALGASGLEGVNISQRLDAGLGHSGSLSAFPNASTPPTPLTTSRIASAMSSARFNSARVPLPTRPASASVWPRAALPEHPAAESETSSLKSFSIVPKSSLPFALAAAATAASATATGHPPPRTTRPLLSAPSQLSACYVRPPSEVHDILAAAAAPMRMSPEDIDAIAETLESNWFDSAQALLRLTVPAGSELDVSKELVGAIHRELQRRNVAPSPSGIALAPAAAGRRGETTPGHNPRSGVDTSSRATSPPATPSWPSGARSASPDTVRARQERHNCKHRDLMEAARTQKTPMMRISNGRWESVEDPWLASSFARRSKGGAISKATISRSIAGADKRAVAVEISSEISPTYVGVVNGELHTNSRPAPKRSLASSPASSPRASPPPRLLGESQVPAPPFAFRSKVSASGIYPNGVARPEAGDSWESAGGGPTASGLPRPAG